MEKIIDLVKEDIQAQKFVTKYCVSNETDAAHVQLSMKRGLPTIPAVIGQTFDEPIAVICSGPSLAENIETIRGFKKIISCSGAHDFLIKNGIIPTWHMETDPREHKSTFVKNPHRDVMYLIASCCHPKVFDNLAGHDVRLWHVFQPDATFPRGHWAILGGSNVGLRALFVARTLGFREIHIFGMDCSGSGRPAKIQTESVPRQEFHVNEHPNEPKKKAIIVAKIGDTEFETTEVFLEYARQYFFETLQVPDAMFVLHGDGLLQRLAEQKLADPMYEGKRKIEQQKLLGKGSKYSTIAVMSQNVISQEYAKLNKDLHTARPDYGIGGAKYAELVTRLREKCKCASVLDYGCGKGMLARSLKFPIWEYDPGVPGKDAPPRPADLTICTDVLEHVEPEYLDFVLGDLARCTRKIGYFVIHTGPSGKTLADGRNSHLIQQGEDWWNDQLSKFFKVGSISRRNRVELHCVVTPRVRVEKAEVVKV
jgi:uncharacterized Rossmann fold enzyme